MSKVDNIVNQHIETLPVLNELKNTRVLSVFVADRGKQFIFTEECDCYYESTLTLDKFSQLIKELQSIERLLKRVD